MMKRIVLGVSLILASFALHAGEVIDINKADAATIAREIKGIGPAKARAIVKYRDTHGPYKRVEDLAKVSGIGEKTVEMIRPQVQVISKRK